MAAGRILGGDPTRGAQMGLEALVTLKPYIPS